MPKNAAVIQAAGKGSRFHTDTYKLLTPIEGKPMILKTLEPVMQAGFDTVAVVIGSHAEEMREALKDFPVVIVENPQWEQGQSTSLSAGLRAVECCSDRACLMLGDQPFLKVSTLKALLAESEKHREDVIVPMYENKRGNPIVVPAYRYGLLLELTKGDTGGKKLLQTVGYRELIVDDPGVVRDIDTTDDIKKRRKDDTVGMNENNFWKIENGAAVPLQYQTHNIADTSPYTPTGAYTTFRTYEHFGVLRLSRHLDRLEETSHLAGFDVKLNRCELKEILVQLLSESTPEEKRIRVTIDLEKQPGTVYIAMESLSVPAAEKYRDGIICRTVEAHRENPKAKLSSFLGKAADLRGREREAFDELLMVTAGGELLEGLSSNFYGVIGGTVYTAEEGVLSGTTRDFILKIAREAGIPVVLRPVRLEEIGNLDEAFISSTSRSVLPIRSINGIVVKEAVPGPVTEKLMELFSSSIEHEIESLRE